MSTYTSVLVFVFVFAFVFSYQFPHLFRVCVPLLLVRVRVLFNRFLTCVRFSRFVYAMVDKGDKPADSRKVVDKAGSSAGSKPDGNVVSTGVVDAKDVSEIVPNVVQPPSSQAGPSSRIPVEVRRALALDDVEEDWSTGNEVTRVRGTDANNNDVDVSDEWIGKPNREVSPIARDGLTFSWGNFPRVDFDASEVIRKGSTKTTDHVVLTRSIASEPWGLNLGVRYRDTFRDRIQVPSSILCDRVFLFDSGDARYVDEVFRYLRDGNASVSPFASLASSWPISVLASGRDDVDRSEKAALSLSGLHGRVISYDDLNVARNVDVDPFRVTMYTRLSLSFAEFPRLPEIMVRAPWPAGLVMSIPRVALYFARYATTLNPVGERRYQFAATLEYVVALVSSLYREIRGSGRVWVLSDMTLTLLTAFHEKRSFPRIPVVDGFVDEVVDFDLTLRLCTEVGSQLPSWKITRNDYPTRTTVSFCLVDKDYRFIPPGRMMSDRPRRYREVGTHRDMGSPGSRVNDTISKSEAEPLPVPTPNIVVPSRVTWDSIMEDSVVRSYTGLDSVFANESERRAGWVLGEIVDGIYRYYNRRLEEWKDRVSRRDQEIVSLRSRLDNRSADPYADIRRTAVDKQDPYRNISHVDPYADIRRRDYGAGPSSAPQVEYDPYANRNDDVNRSPKRTRFDAPPDVRTAGHPASPRGYVNPFPSYHYPRGSGPSNPQ